MVVAVEMAVVKAITMTNGVNQSSIPHTVGVADSGDGADFYYTIVQRTEYFYCI